MKILETTHTRCVCMCVWTAIQHNVKTLSRHPIIFLGTEAFLSNIFANKCIEFTKQNLHLFSFSFNIIQYINSRKYICENMNAGLRRYIKGNDKLRLPIPISVKVWSLYNTRDKAELTQTTYTNQPTPRTTSKNTCQFKNTSSISALHSKQIPRLI